MNPPSKPHYQCVRCGNCCRWPGVVKITDAEISAIARFLGMEETDFIQQHTRLRPTRDGLSLLENPDGSCAFLDGINTCLLQPVKPAQCRAFPNEWNFPGWRDLCEAVETPQAGGLPNGSAALGGSATFPS